MGLRLAPEGLLVPGGAHGVGAALGHGIAVSPRPVGRSVGHLRRELLAEAWATVRFETPPGRRSIGIMGAMGTAPRAVRMAPAGARTVARRRGLRCPL